MAIRFLGLELDDGDSLGTLPKPAGEPNHNRCCIHYFFDPNRFFLSPPLRRLIYSKPEHDPFLNIWELDGGRFFHLHYQDETEFGLRGCGEEIGCRWAETSSADYSAEYLFGPIPGFVLILRGIVILHASAVACSRGAIALLGDAGAGKSSTAAAFAMRGAPVLTDDIVTLDEKEPTKGFLVHSGLPQIKLWPSSVEMLFGTPDALPRLTPNSDKCYLDLTQPGYGFQEEPLPLSAIYVLGERKDDDSAFHIEPVTGAQAMLTLVANSYCCHVLNAEQRVHEFEVFKQLIPKVPIRRVTPHGDPAKIWQLCDVIQRDFVRRLRRSTQMKAKLF